MKGTDAQIEYAAALLAKLQEQSDTYVTTRLASIEKRVKDPEKAKAKKLELWEEIRDLRIILSIESAGVMIEYLKKVDLDRELVENPSMRVRYAMGLDKAIPQELTQKGWTKDDTLFQEMIEHYGLQDCGPAS
jgi:hypothetical protein